MSACFSDIVSQVHGLDFEEKRELLDLIRQWLVEERRSEIKVNAREALREFQEGKAKRGSLDDLMDDLYAEDR